MKSNSLWFLKYTFYCVIFINSFTVSAQKYEWSRISERTQFSPRDSSPDACLVFNGKYFVLGGWRFNGTEWKSYSDVWESEDGVNWQLLNSSPPYSHYSSFVVFNRKIWAFSERSYYSDDGKEWKEVTTSIPMEVHNRVTVFKNRLWYQKNRLIMSSSDGLTWRIETEQAPWQEREEVKMIVFKAKLYLLGGSVNYNTGNDFYYNDIWVSSDGRKWKEIVKNAEWPGRYWFSLEVFDNKLWLFGGWDYHQQNNGEFGNLNDIWVSSDGKSWENLKFKVIWPSRHAVFTWTDKNGLWMSSGYGHGGITRLYNDVWILRKLK